MGDASIRSKSVDSFDRRKMIVGTAAALGGLAISSVEVLARPASDEISHSAAAIHQEVNFKASRNRVYEALTDGSKFNKVILLSAAMQGGMPPGAAPTQISGEAGGAFALFGGYVTGRQIELVRDQRIVQAWRAGSWGPGIYSIAKFELADEGSDTKLVFDHTGFPLSQAQHLADGWKSNYWEPLAKFLA